MSSELSAVVAEVRLQQGLLGHTDRFAHGMFPALVQAIDAGKQTPIATIYKLGAPFNYSSPFIFGALPGEAFYVSGISAEGAKFAAAAFYSANMLGVRNHILTFYGSALPDAKIINAYEEAATHLTGHITKNDMNICGVYFDTCNGNVWALGEGIPTIKLGQLEPQPQGKPKIWACSCCDSRAAAHDTFSLHANEADTINVIGGFVPSQRQNPDMWQRIMLAAGSGIEDFVVTTHSQCGGVAALVSWSLDQSKKPHHKLLPWLSLIKPSVDVAVAVARDNGIEDFAKLCGIVERYLAVVSGKNLQEGLERVALLKSNLYLHHLDITTREVEDLRGLDLLQIIRNVKHGERFTEFCSIGDHREELGDVGQARHPVLIVPGETGMRRTLFAKLKHRQFLCT